MGAFPTAKTGPPPHPSPTNGGREVCNAWGEAISEAARKSLLASAIVLTLRGEAGGGGTLRTTPTPAHPTRGREPRHLIGRPASNPAVALPVAGNSGIRQACTA